VGVAISKRLQTDKQEDFVAEPSFARSVAQDVLGARLERSSFMSVDDTGARHAAKSGFCTQIDSDWFTSAPGYRKAG